MRINKLAFVLVGGICSGKTTLTNTLERLHNVIVISKDRCIYESDMLCRENIFKSWEFIREEHINNLYNENVVIDETIRVGRLDTLKGKGYTIIGILLENDKRIRTERLLQRNELQRQYLNELSNITKIDLLSCDQETRRTYWRSQCFHNTIAKDIRNHFDFLLKELYLLGSSVLKDEEPNPVCFSEIDYVIDAKNIDISLHSDLSLVVKNSIPYNDYLKKWAKKIKYCIWDVGGVFYDYSLEKLNSWCFMKTSNLDNWERVKGTFSFNEYMTGDISFEELCIKICDYYSITYSSEYNLQIENCLRAGIGEMFTTTEESIEFLKQREITNCVLSNALPILADDGNYPNLINQEYRFYSFEFNVLKPNNKIYTMMRDRLNVPFENMIFIDDKQRNVDAARELGIYSITFNKDTIIKEISRLFE